MTVNWTKRIGRVMFGTVLLGRFLTGGVEAAPIEMQVVEGDVRSVLMSLARAGHENIVLDDSVAGTVTLHVIEEPTKLLRMVAASKGLVLVKEGTTYLVTTAARADGLRSVHVYPVRHADPADIARAAELSLRSAADRADAEQEGAAAVRAASSSIARRILCCFTARRQRRRV